MDRRWSKGRPMKSYRMNVEYLAELNLVEDDAYDRKRWGCALSSV